MPLDSITQVTRTAAGVNELSKPTHGLSIGQRKLLTFLDTPRAFGAVVGDNQLDPEKAERDLAKLKDLKLVDYAGPARPVAPQGPVTVSQMPGAPVVVGGRRNASPMRWVGLAIVALIAIGGWLAFKPSAQPAAPAVADAGATPAPAATAAAAASAAPPPAATATAPVAAVLPVAATMLGDPKDARKDAKEVREAKPEPEPRAEVKLSAADIARLSGTAAPTPAPNLGTAPVVAQTTVAAAKGPTPAPAVQPAVAQPAPAQPAAVARPAPVVAEPTLAAATPPVQVAAATPSTLEAKVAAPKPVLGELVAVSREQPPFPREAISAGVSKGTVRARVVVDAAGHVTSVSIIEANPRRIFDRVVTSSLSQWTFNAGAAGRSTDVDIVFNRD